MYGKCGRKIFLSVCAIGASLCLGSTYARGQQNPNLVASGAPGSEAVRDASEPSDTSAATLAGAHPASAPITSESLSKSLGDLQMEVQALNAQLSEVRAAQERTSEEALALRHELDLLRGDMPRNTTEIASLPLSASTANSIAALTPAQEPTTSERLDKLEENQDVLEGKVNDQYQTKVESGSKYRLRLSGIVLLNLYDNRGPVDNQDFPQLVEAPEEQLFSASPSSFGGSVRQSQIKLQAFGPDIFGARSSADLEFDFAGGFTNEWNGAAMGLVRLRTGTIRLDWTNTSIVAGQDSMFFVPLAPTSLASMAIPALSYTGNLWAWMPQVRIEHKIALSDASNIQLQAGILDSLTGDPPEPPDSPNRLPSWGEESGQPAYAARIAWSHREFGQNLTVGAGGYYARQNWGLSRDLDSWAGTIDLTAPLGKMFEFTGAFYRGRGVAGLGGGIGQSVVLNGSFFSPATRFIGLDSMGGWAQLKFKPSARLQINAAFGLDNPTANELRTYATNSIYSDSYTRNLSPLANIIYQLRSDLLVSVEYRWLKTTILDAGANSASQINLTLGYIF